MERALFLRVVDSPARGCQEPKTQHNTQDKEATGRKGRTKGKRRHAHTPQEEGHAHTRKLCCACVLKHLKQTKTLVCVCELECSFCMFVCVGVFVCVACVHCSCSVQCCSSKSVYNLS